MEAVRLNAVIVDKDIYVRDIRDAAPEIAFFPVLRESRWFEKNDIGRQSPLCMGHDRAKFSDSGPGAGTMRMRQNYQRRVVQGRLNLAIGRPLVRRISGDTRSILISPKYRKAETDNYEP